MNLLFAIKSLNVVGGGAERVLVDVANGLVAKGHKVQVLTFDDPGESFYSLDRRIIRLDAGIGHPGQPTPRTGFIKAMPEVRRLICEADPDLVVAFMHSTYVPISAALLGTGLPLVASEHIDAAHYQSRPFQRALVWMADRLAIAKTVPSAPIRKQHNKAFQNRVHVMPNAVNIANFESTALIKPQEPPHILSVGRFMAQKNHLELIKAFALVADRFPNWNMRIVGEGELRFSLEAHIERLGLSTRVTLPGVTKNIASEYAAASIVALPSLYESFGLVAAEALASARPLLAFDHCLGISELVKNEENGLLVSGAGDRVGHLAQGLDRLMSDSHLRARLGMAGPESIRRFDLSGVVDTWESLLKKLTED